MDVKDVVEIITPHLKSLGYRKRNLAWKKNSKEINLYFWIEKSLYSKQDWYYWWGIHIPSIEPATNLKTSPFVCQIRFRADNKGLSAESLVDLTEKWEEMYGSRDKLREAAVYGKLPPLTNPNTISHLLLGDF